MTLVRPVDHLVDTLARTGAKPRRSGSGWSARCPSHPDRNPSLSVSEGQDGNALVKCHAGCSSEAVLHALRLAWSDLFADERTNGTTRIPEPEPPFTPQELRQFLDDCHQALLSAPEAGAARSYLRRRGLAGDEVRRFGLGFGVQSDVPKFAALRNRITFGVPPHGAEGRTVPNFDADVWSPAAKYLTVGSKRAWGLQDVDPSAPLVLVEGVFDRIALARAGVQSVALRGKSLHANDGAWIAARGFGHLYLLLDGDVSLDDLTRLQEDLTRAGLTGRLCVGLDEGDAGDLLAADEGDLLVAVSAALATPGVEGPHYADIPLTTESIR